MSAHKNYVLLDLGLHKFKGHQESTNDWFLINTPDTFLQISAKIIQKTMIKGFYVRALNSQKVYAKIKWGHCNFNQQ